jgi:hypothetical protein
MEPCPDYAAIYRLLRERMRWRQACLGRADDLPDPDMIMAWAMQLEVLHRLEAAQAAGDLGRLQALLPLARRIIGS